MTSMTIDGTIDARALRDACGRFATGVTVITTLDAEGPHGMTANAFMSLSLDPPLIAISLDNNSRMLGKVRGAGAYAVNILAHGMEPVALHFAGRHDPALSRVLEIREGLPVLPGAAVQLIADVVNEVPAGDHTLFIGVVRAILRGGRRAAAAVSWRAVPAAVRGGLTGLRPAPRLPLPRPFPSGWRCVRLWLAGVFSFFRRGVPAWSGSGAGSSRRPGLRRAGRRSEGRRPGLRAAWAGPPGAGRQRRRRRSRRR